MRLETRKLLDKSFSGLGLFSLFIMGGALLVILLPIFKRGSGAFLFQGTIEHRRFLMDKFERGNRSSLDEEIVRVNSARRPIYRMLNQFEAEQGEKLNEVIRLCHELGMPDDAFGKKIKRRLKRLNKAEDFSDKFRILQDVSRRFETYEERSVDLGNKTKVIVKRVSQLELSQESFSEVKELVHDLLGPAPGAKSPVLVRKQYGQSRWERAQIKLHLLLNTEEWDYSDSSGMGKLFYTPRMDEFEGTALEPLFPYIEQKEKELLEPRWTFYWGFLTDKSMDAHMFGGIMPEVLGTIYLTLGAILFAVPIGIITAIYLTEYTQGGYIVSFLRSCISTLAGVPSIVFGLFGLAFFINTLHVSPSKSVLAGSLTLGLLILPMIIRASEEAIKSVPQTYKSAALSLGAGKWHTVLTIVLPSALPGILTGIVISMGRAAGETAPIIFTAAVSVMGVLYNPIEALSHPTYALSWNIFNLSTEHEAVDEIRHVQFGMVMVLILIVLLFNLTAVILRARISKKLQR
ncbi:MAG: phosphate ABC transporter permease PstA [Opitutaceae bacterium]|nr:phosphate ABC transporter permease PstA [Opitutaceae bacterium]